MKRKLYLILNFNKINAKEIIFKISSIYYIFCNHIHMAFYITPFGDDIYFAKVYHNQNIFNFLYIRYESWTSRLLIEFFLVPLAGLPKIVWNFFDSIVFLLIAVLIPKVIFNMEKIDAKKSLYTILYHVFLY